MRGILKYCVRGMLGEQQRETLFMDAIAALCAPSQDVTKVDKLQEQVDIALV